MKLLIDENISYRIIKLIEDHFPGSTHVSSISNSGLTDLEIWEYAKNNILSLLLMTRTSTSGSW